MELSALLSDHPVRVFGNYEVQVCKTAASLHRIANMKNRLLTIWSLAPNAGLSVHPRRPVRRGVSESDGPESWPQVKSAKRAIDDFLAFSAHIRVLLKDKFAVRIGIVEWLDRIDASMEALVAVLETGELEVMRANEDTSDEFGQLEYELENCWLAENFEDEFAKLCPESIGCETLTALVEYWVDQIKERGWAIHGILIGSEGVLEVGNALANIRNINYPPRYPFRFGDI